MLRRMITYLIVLSAGLLITAPSSARERRHIDATSFLDAPCSVLSGEPCTPFCSVFNHGPCIPEIADPYGENLQVTIQSQPSHDDATKYQKPDHDLNTIGDLFAALRSCWSPPPADEAREGMQMSVLFSFKKSGAMIAPPRMTFATQGAPADIRDAYLKSINVSLIGCEPFKFTAGLSDAIAGRPIMIRYVDNRDLEKQSGAPSPLPSAAMTAAATIQRIASLPQKTSSAVLKSSLLPLAGGRALVQPASPSGVELVSSASHLVERLSFNAHSLYPWLAGLLIGILPSRVS